MVFVISLPESNHFQQEQILQEVLDNGGTVPEKLKTQVVAVRKKIPAQSALEKELKERNPILIQKLKDVRK
jgi:hypothetical protein